MSRENMKHRVLEALEEVVGKYALMFMDAQDDEYRGHRMNNCLKGTVRFTGEVSGELNVFSTMNFCRVLSENVLGVKKRDSEASKNSYDTFREFSNILCGHFLTNIYGDSAIFNLMPPELDMMPAEAWQRELKDCDVAVFAEDSPLAVKVSINRGC